MIISAHIYLNYNYLIAKINFNENTFFKGHRLFTHNEQNSEKCGKTEVNLYLQLYPKPILARELLNTIYISFSFKIGIDLFSNVNQKHLISKNS
jgi:hypothetical protein